MKLISTKESNELIYYKISQNIGKYTNGLVSNNIILKVNNSIDFEIGVSSYVLIKIVLKDYI